MSSVDAATSTVQKLRSRLGTTNQLPTNLFAGVVVGPVNVVFSTSYAALIFSGPPVEFLPFGISSALTSAVILAVILALTSSFTFAIGGPDSNASAFMALIIAAIAAGSMAAGSTQAVLPTVMVTLALSAILTGLVLLGGGLLRLGRWARFSPYPVVMDRPSQVYRLTRQSLDRMQADEPALAALFHQFIARLIADRLVTTSETVDLLLS